jgi:uncharacterized membrane protein YoaK (UPF0700 family)
LSTTAGAVDVIGFLSLGGLFTAHMTGNLVVLAAHYVTGDFAEIGPLLAVPVFVAVLCLVSLASLDAEQRGYRPRRGLLLLQAVLLASAGLVGTAWGPFVDPDAPAALVAGMLAVAAMATQNALVRLALPGAPSTAVMTTNISQLSVDLARLARGAGDPADLDRAWERTGTILPCLVGFAAGCAGAAAFHAHSGTWALAFPVALAVVAVALDRVRSECPETRLVPAQHAGPRLRAWQAQVDSKESTQPMKESAFQAGRRCR